MIAVGLTGGIGSGKSTVAKIFSVLQVPVYYADDAAKRLMTSDAQVRQAIQDAFGKEMYDNAGQLQRKKLAATVFQDAVSLQQLNDIVHPAVARDSKHWLQQHQSYPYVIKEAALLFEAGSYKALDVMVCVVAPKAIRVARVMQRDGLSEGEVHHRMDRQWPQEKKASMSDHIIENDGTKALIPQVWALHRQWMPG